MMEERQSEEAINIVLTIMKIKMILGKKKITSFDKRIHTPIPIMAAAPRMVMVLKK